MNRKCVSMHIRSILQEKMEILQERQFWVGHLSINYGSCFNASLSRYTMQIYFAFIKLIRRK